MAMGLACISTDCPCGGPRYLIENNVNGLLVPVNNRHAMAKAMAKLVENDILRQSIAEKAREINTRLNTDKICKKWREYCELIIGK